MRAMKSLISSGVSAAQAAVEARRAPQPSPAGEGAAGGYASERLIAALERYDGPGADSILDTAIASLSAPAFAATVALPAIEEIGRRWSAGEVSIAQEHFASNLIRGRMLGLARGWGRGLGADGAARVPPR